MEAGLNKGDPEFEKPTVLGLEDSSAETMVNQVNYDEPFSRKWLWESVLFVQSSR